jgi:GH24 family phage-related lysozyme (muramidase)
MTKAGRTDGAGAEAAGLAEFQRLMTEEEGRRNRVYLDSRGFATVGVGHLVRPGDRLEVGDVIPDARVDALFRADGARALEAARAQAAQAGVPDPAFVSRLAAVNFQLGGKWPREFPRTWGLILAGDYAGAADELENSKWFHQTPARVRAFQAVLHGLADTDGRRRAGRRIV